MKKGIHPKNHLITVKCASCGTTFETLSTLSAKTLNIDICSNCHPFYIGAKAGAMTVKGRAEKLSGKFESGKKTAVEGPVKKAPTRSKANKKKALESLADIEQEG